MFSQPPSATTVSSAATGSSVLEDFDEAELMDIKASNSLETCFKEIMADQASEKMADQAQASDSPDSSVESFKSIDDDDMAAIKNIKTKMMNLNIEETLFKREIFVDIGDDEKISIDVDFKDPEWCNALASDIYEHVRHEKANKKAINVSRITIPAVEYKIYHDSSTVEYKIDHDSSTAGTIMSNLQVTRSKAHVENLAGNIHYQDKQVVAEELVDEEEFFEEPTNFQGEARSLVSASILENLLDASSAADSSFEVSTSVLENLLDASSAADSSFELAAGNQELEIVSTFEDEPVNEQRLVITRRRVEFRDDENEKLDEGYAKFAQEGKNVPWKKILEFGRGVFDPCRTATSLKDKYKSRHRQRGNP